MMDFEVYWFPTYQVVKLADEVHIDGQKNFLGSLRRVVFTLGALLLLIWISLKLLSVDIKEVVGLVLKVEPTTILVMLALTTFSYSIRALRWFLINNSMILPYKELRRAPFGQQSLIFFAGFAFALTPGRMGEAVRIWMMRRSFGTPLSMGIALSLTDRIYDALSISLLVLALGILLSQSIVTTAVVLGFLVVSGLLILRVSILEEFLISSEERWPRAKAYCSNTRIFIMHFRTLGGYNRVALYLSLSAFAWTLEGLAMSYLAFKMKLPLTPLASLFSFTLATLAGAISLLPGGLGGFEVAMIATLTSHGVSVVDAAAATALIRLTTLWFGFVIGWIALGAWVALRRGDRSNHGLGS